MSSQIKHLFEPRAVAIIGASYNSEKVGYKILENIINGGYRGKIFPVNPKNGEILGREVCKSILDINEKIDLAILAIPADKIYGAVRECAEKKVKFLAIVASGFAEIGNGEEEKKIASFARKNGVRILGPNIFGIYSAKASLNATFGAKVGEPGGVAIITQSGALGIALMGKTQTEGIGLSSIVFVGNKADINEADLLPYFSQDEKTKVIFIYLEGVKNGEKFAQSLRETTKKKPVIILKAGLSERGARAAVSHTGSLAGEARIFSAVTDQCGAIRAGSLSEAIDWLKFLSAAPLLKGGNTLIITNGGGMGILATDACEKYGLNLYDNQTVLDKSFSKLIPGFGSIKNPIDITGQATDEDYKKALLEALNNNNYHSVICLGCETAVLDNKKLAGVFREIYQKTKAVKPVVFAFVGGSEVEEKLLSLQKEGVPIFAEIQQAVSCLGVLYQHKRNIKKQETVSEKKANSELFLPINKIIDKAEKAGERLLSPSGSKKVLEHLDIPTPKFGYAKNSPEAVKIAKEIGFPVTLKVVSKDIIHKTDAGGVVLNITNSRGITSACASIKKSCHKFNPGAKIEGFEISKMIEGGIELIVAAKKDRDFGTIVMFGLGGIYVEVFKDVSFRSFPLSIDEAEEMIKEIKAYRLLAGARGEKRSDIKAIAKTIFKLGELVENCPKIDSIELNPLKVFEEGRGITALDVRVLLKD